MYERRATNQSHRAPKGCEKETRTQSTAVYAQIRNDSHALANRAGSDAMPCEITQ